MPLRLNPEPPTWWEPVTVGDDSFQIQVQAPTYHDQLTDHELLHREVYNPRAQQGARIEHRLQSAIVGWDGLEIEGQNGETYTPDFDWSLLKQLCGQYPQIGQQIIRAANRAYDRPGLDRGNSPARSGSHSEAAESRTHGQSATSGSDE